MGFTLAALIGVWVSRFAWHDWYGNVFIKGWQWTTFFWVGLVVLGCGLLGVTLFVFVFFGLFVGCLFTWYTVWFVLRVWVADCLCAMSLGC